jgi:hypothetical protein
MSLSHTNTKNMNDKHVQKNLQSESINGNKS